MAKKHSFVHDIRIATPCKADWNKMTGDERVRFCGQCKLNVYNISEMTTDEAEKLIIEKEGKLCVRMYRRADGTLLNKDCPVGVLKRRCAAAFSTVSAAVAVFAAWVLKTSPTAHEPELGTTTGQLVARHEDLQPVVPPPPCFLMGSLAPPPPPMVHTSPLNEVYMGGRHGEKQ